MFWENYVNTKAVDALAPHVARTSAAMVLTMQDEQILVFDKEGFQPLTPHKFFIYIQIHHSL